MWRSIARSTSSGSKFGLGITTFVAPNPNAARLLQNWLHGIEAQQIIVDFAAQHSVHALVKPKPGRKSLAEIKVFKDDPAGVEKEAEEIKARYTRIFKV